MLMTWLRRYCLPTLLALIALTSPLPAWALPEAELAASFETQVRPYFKGQFATGSFKGAGGVTLCYAERPLPNPHGSLVLVGGRTEFLLKYAELLYDLRELPFAIYILEHRGQGGSERLLPEPDKGHVDNFQDYVDDLSTFIDTVVRPQPQQPLTLLTHSMGGTIAALYANSHPGLVSGMILNAPMLAINTKPFPEGVARLLAQGASRLGFRAAYVPGGGPYDPAKPFSQNEVTQSPVRFALNQRLALSSPARPLGSPTYGWLAQAFAGMASLAREHRGLTMPVLLLAAGADTVVDKRPQVQFCADLPDCSLVEIPGARHEILMEEDSIRERALSLIRDFLARFIPHQPQGASNINPLFQEPRP